MTELGQKMVYSYSMEQIVVTTGWVTCSNYKCDIVILKGVKTFHFGSFPLYELNIFIQLQKITL